MKSIYLRYFFVLAVLFLVSFTVLGAFFLNAATRSYSVQRIETLGRSASQASAAVGGALGRGSDEIDGELAETLYMLAVSLDAHILVSDADGNILIRCEPSGVSYTGGRLPAEIMRGMEISGVGVVYLASDEPFEKGSAVLTKTVEDVFGAYALVAVSAAENPSGNLMGMFARTYLLTAVIVMLVAVFSVYGTTRFMARPLRAMAVCAQSFAQGNFSVRVNRWMMERGDEMGELAYAFNAMADALSKQEELRRDFIANVSHELKTPMTIISGYIGGILDGTIPAEKAPETLSMVRGEVLRLSRMVSSMTQISAIQVGHMEIKPAPLNICETAMRVLLGMEKNINDKELQVEIFLPEEQEAMVMADPDGMVQVLTNLLDNAVKFSPQGGTLAFSITRHSGGYIIRVRNNAPDIPAADLPYIFDRFHKADRSRSKDRAGLGLGLYLVKSILGAHKTDIFVKSEGGVTEFSFTLPEARI